MLQVRAEVVERRRQISANGLKYHRLQGLVRGIGHALEALVDLSRELNLDRLNRHLYVLRKAWRILYVEGTRKRSGYS